MRLFVVGLVLCAAVVVAVWRLLSLDAPTPGTAVVVTPHQPTLVAHDSSGHGNDGVIQGRFVMGLPGHQGTSYGIRRLGSWIEVPSDPELNPGDRNFRFSAWVNIRSTPHSHGGSYDIIRKGLSYTPTGEYKLEIIHGGRVRCTAKDATGHWSRTITWDREVTDGRWHLIGCARTGDEWTAFADRKVFSRHTRLQSIGNDMPLSIGSKYGDEDVPTGRIDDIRLRIGGRLVGEWDLDERPDD